MKHSIIIIIIMAAHGHDDGPSSFHNNYYVATGHLGVLLPLLDLLSAVDTVVAFQAANPPLKRHKAWWEKAMPCCMEVDP
mmetsp:Transcript_15794/g.23940  ORF Transcript_15794/g.23940 Transcript_15794/m.23940 type:complete len:80 (-) Transcript_15794:101-340(-)